MEVEFAGIFEKDLKFIKDRAVLRSVTNLIRGLETANSLNEIKGLKKLRGFAGSYRLRIGNYRIGFYLLENDVILLKRILHRKDIYKYFP